MQEKNFEEDDLCLDKSCRFTYYKKRIYQYIGFFIERGRLVWN